MCNPQSLGFGGAANCVALWMQRIQFCALFISVLLLFFSFSSLFLLIAKAQLHTHTPTHT